MSVGYRTLALLSDEASIISYLVLLPPSIHKAVLNPSDAHNVTLKESNLLKQELADRFTNKFVFCEKR